MDDGGNELDDTDVDVTTNSLGSPSEATEASWSIPAAHKSDGFQPSLK